VHAAVPDGKAVDVMILSTVKRKASSPLNGTDHEVCAFRILQLYITQVGLWFTGLQMR
jgi:hypothetical protein